MDLVVRTKTSIQRVLDWGEEKNEVGEQRRSRVLRNALGAALPFAKSAQATFFLSLQMGKGEFQRFAKIPPAPFANCKRRWGDFCNLQEAPGGDVQIANL